MITPVSVVTGSIAEMASVALRRPSALKTTMPIVTAANSPKAARTSHSRVVRREPAGPTTSAVSRRWLIQRRVCSSERATTSSARAAPAAGASAAAAPPLPFPLSSATCPPSLGDTGPFGAGRRRPARTVAPRLPAQQELAHLVLAPRLEDGEHLVAGVQHRLAVDQL